MGVEERLKYIIEQTGLKREQFAKATNVSVGQLFKYLNGSQLPSFKLMTNIKKILPKLNGDWFLTGKGHPFLRDYQIEDSSHNSESYPVKSEPEPAHKEEKKGELERLENLVCTQQEQIELLLDALKKSTSIKLERVVFETRDKSIHQK